MRTLLIGVCLMALAGCHDDMSMGNYEGSMSSHLDQIGTVADQHVRDVEAAADVVKLPDLVSAYHTRMTGHMDGMGQNMSGMHACHGGDNRQPDTAAMHADLAEIQAELADHRARMASAIDMAAARAEVARHHDAMLGLMSQMRGDMTTMMSSARDFECDHCMGCGH